MNDFNKFGKSYRVIIQADAIYRREGRYLQCICEKQRRENGAIEQLVTLTPREGPDVKRFSGSADYTIAPALGYSSGQAIQAVREVAAKTLPFGFGVSPG